MGVGLGVDPPQVCANGVGSDTEVGRSLVDSEPLKELSCTFCFGIGETVDRLQQSIHSADPAVRVEYEYHCGGAELVVLPSPVIVESSG